MGIKWSISNRFSALNIVCAIGLEWYDGNLGKKIKQGIGMYLVWWRVIAFSQGNQNCVWIKFNKNRIEK
jgi:hypothetical protein